jgi:hypothetical protein
MEKLLHNVNELPASARSTVENLVGHPLRDDQQLYIVALDASVEPVREQRRAAWDELKSMLDVMHENARQSGRAPEEIDRLVDEACESVRYGG